MSRTKTYYRVSLAHGITPEQRPYGYYSGSEELGKTAFKSLRTAKRAFEALCKAEIERIKELRSLMRKIQTRGAIQASGAAQR